MGTVADSDRSPHRPREAGLKARSGYATEQGTLFQPPFMTPRASCPRTSPPRSAGFFRE